MAMSRTCRSYIVSSRSAAGRSAWSDGLRRPMAWKTVWECPHSAGRKSITRRNARGCGPRDRLADDWCAICKQEYKRR